MTLGARLLMLIAFALLPPLAIQAWNGLEQRRERETVLRNVAMAQGRAVQAGMARVAEGVHQLLTAMAEAQVIRHGDLPGCTDYLQAVAARFSNYTLLGVHDVAGQLLCNSLGAAPGSFSTAGRAYHERAMASGRFAAGDLVVGMATHKPSLHFAMPFRHADGSAGGIVLAGIDQAWLSQQLAASALPPGAQGLILDPSGNLVAAVQDGRPVLESLIGTRLPASLRAAVDVRSPTTVQVAGLDGRPRLLGAVPADPDLVGIVVAVALDETMAFADLHAGNDRSLLGLLAAALLALLAARFGASRFVLAPLRGLVRAADRVGRGDLGARVDLGTRAGAIRDVGAAFDRMSVALAAREDERDQAEAAQRLGEARLGRILAATPAGILELDRDGQIVFANAAAERIIGPGNLVGRTYDDPAWYRGGIPGTGGRAEGSDALSRVLQGEPVMDREYALTAQDGRRVVLLVDMVPIRDMSQDGSGGPGRVVGALAAFQDVTVRQAQGQALQEGQTRLRLLLDSMGEGFYAIDCDGMTTLCNRSFLRLLGFKREEEAIGRKLHDVIHHSHADGSPYPVCACPIYQTARTGEPVHIVGELFYRVDGSSFPVEYWVQPLWHDGTLQGAVCTFVDVTEREQAAAALGTSEERLRLAQRAGGIGTFEFDLASQRVTVSEEFCRLWGITLAESFSLETLFAMVEEEDRKGIEGTHAATAEGWLGYVEYRIRRGDTGEVRWLARRGEPRPKADGREVEAFVGVVYDVTDRRRMEAELRQLNDVLERRVAERTEELMAAEETLRQSQKMEAVGQLTGGIAHDFNNMLQAIGGSLEMVRRRVDQGRASEASRFLDSAGKTVERAAGLTHRLLAFARRQTLQPREIDTNALVVDMEELIRRTVGQVVRVQLRLGEPVSAISCDPNQLENVLLNLAINARDAMPDGGTITIGTGDVVVTPEEMAGRDAAAGGAFVEISVADTGTGMDEATRARAFEPFYTTKPIGQGTGLGLSQVYGFVRQSEGLVRLESELGRGTVVRLYLPRHAVAAPALRAADKIQQPGWSATVLLVEDEAEVRSIAAGHLRELGYRVLEAADGPQALDLLKTMDTVGLLVTDVGLPGGLNGRQVADAARERRPGLPVLFITGYAGAALAEGLGPGMEVIGKPFTLDALAGRICGMLASVP